MYKDLKEFVKSKTFRTASITAAVVALILLVFHAGVLFGYHRAAFSYRFGDNYYRIFGDFDDKPFYRGHMRPRFMEAHGTAGKIVSINLPSFVVADRSNFEKIVIVDGETRIRFFDKNASSTDLQIGSNVVIFGAPDADAKIHAKLIRLFPATTQLINK